MGGSAAQNHFFFFLRLNNYFNNKILRGNILILDNKIHFIPGTHRYVTKGQIYIFFFSENSLSSLQTKIGGKRLQFLFREKCHKGDFIYFLLFTLDGKFTLRDYYFRLYKKFNTKDAMLAVD